MSSKRIKLQENALFCILRLFQNNPEMFQREFAAAIGVNVGSLHYVLIALIEKGLVKLGIFSKIEDMCR